jgi:hypothetical protein
VTPAVLNRARAYCGPAHHHEWLVPGECPEIVTLLVPAGWERYRLVRNPATGLPARDSTGALVFVPDRGEPLR